MARLYIIRHAWAGDRDDRLYPSDDLRPLTDEGRKRFRKMARDLVDRGLAPHAIATSPLVRCRQTADILAHALDGRPAVIEREELAPGSDLDGLVAWSRTQPDELAWVGHAPDVSEFVAALIGDRRAAIDFSKGAVAALHFDGPIAPDQGLLQWLITAKMLGV